MNDDIIKSIPPEELKKKQEEARTALSGGKTRPATQQIKKDRGPILKEVDKETILRSFSAEELHKKKAEAKIALGDTRSEQQIKESIQPREITKMEKEALARGDNFAQQILSKNRAVTEEEEFTDPEEEGPFPEKPTPLATPIKPPEKVSSLSEIALRERERKEAMKQVDYSGKKGVWQVIVFAATLILVVAGTGLISYYAFFKDEPVELPRPTPDKIYLITPDTETRLNASGLSSSELKAEFEKMRSSLSIPPNTIQSVLLVLSDNPELKTVSAEEALSAFAGNPPERLSSALGEEYMAGLYSGRGNYAFLAFEITSFETSARAMLEWEEGGLKDLAATLGAASVGDAQKDQRWEDAYVKNVDARILKDSSEDVLLVYSFPDKKTLIITPGISTFNEAVGRYNTPEKILR